MEQPRGWYSRGYLPHIDAGSTAQFITWRLADSLPEVELARLRGQLELLPPEERKREGYIQVEALLDRGFGSCLLKEPAIARIVADHLLQVHRAGSRVDGFVVMPNHVHAVVTPAEGQTLAKLMQWIKGSSARQINLRLGTNGSVWQRESFDRIIRDAEHWRKVIHYIEWNPVKAGLASDPSNYVFSSANESTWRDFSARADCGEPG